MIMGSVQPQSLQVVRHCIRNFIKNIVLPRNGVLSRIMAFSKTCLSATNNVVYVSGRGMVIIGQFAEFEIFDSRMI